jgi:predicted Zn-dependent protease
MMKTLRLKSEWKLGFFFFLILFCIHSVIPDKVLGITIKEEEELSKEFLKVIEKRFTIIRDPLITAYVNTVGSNILSAMPPQPFPYHFHVIKQHVYNAFATPAGHIFVNSGLLAAFDREEELAGILAHEIAHVVCRHISQNIERAPKIGLATLAGIAAGIFLGAGGVAALGNAVTMGSIAASQSVSLAFSRDDELQADQLALEYLSQSGYGAEGLLSAMKKIRSKQWFGTDQIPDYLMTHPASEERMALIDSWIENNPIPPGSKRSIDRKKFLLVRATLLGKYGDEQTALPALQSQVQADPDDPLANYGFALALANNGNRKEALQYLQKALAREALNPYLIKELGRIYFLDGAYEKARSSLEGAISLIPDDTEALFYLGRSYMELNQLEKARDTFHTLLQKDPSDKDAYLFLGNIYGQQERLGEAHYYLGIYYKMISRWKTAAVHLNKALQYTTDPKKKEELEGMLKTVQEESKREAAGKRN